MDTGDEDRRQQGTRNTYLTTSSLSFLSSRPMFLTSYMFPLFVNGRTRALDLLILWD